MSMDIWDRLKGGRESLR